MVPLLDRPPIVRYGKEYRNGWQILLMFDNKSRGVFTMDHPPSTVGTKIRRIHDSKPGIVS